MSCPYLSMRVLQMVRYLLVLLLPGGTRFLLPRGTPFVLCILVLFDDVGLLLLVAGLT